MVRLLSLPTLGAFLYAATSTVSALTASADGQFNIQSPNSFGIFVAGQILPVTYQLDDSTSCKLFDYIKYKHTFFFFLFSTIHFFMSY